MKSLKKVAFLAGLAGGLLVSAEAQPVDPPAPNNTQAPAPGQPNNDQSPAPTPADAAPAPGQPADSGPMPEPPAGMPAPADASPGPNDPTAPQQGDAAQTQSATLAPNASITLLPPATTGTNYGDKGLRMNFRGVPLEMVLNYMSDAAGYIIVLETDVKGTVDVWSNQPLNKTEAVALLNNVLNKNGYAAIQDGRTLTIVSREEARKRDIPVKSGNIPSEIPKNAEIVTQIIPVRSLNATQLTKDLAPLLPSDTSLTANEAGNALVMTDTQANIRRMAEIVKALDAVSSSVNSIKVFQLQYADSKTMVAVIEKLFPTQTTSQQGGGGQGGFGGGRMGMMFGFGGGRGGGGGGGNGATANAAGSKPSAHVSAVSDDNSNTLIVSAPDEVMPLIKELMTSLDTPITDITELRVFPLKYSDPTEMANLLTSLFPDDTSSGNSNGSNGNRYQGPMGFPFGGGGGRNNNNNSANTSNRNIRKGRVIAVPDPRTASVVISADKSLMSEIASMVEQLDGSPAKKQKVFVYTLQNADVQDVQPVLEDLFLSNNSRNRSSSSSQSANPLTTRNNQMQQQSSSSSTFGSSRSTP